MNPVIILTLNNLALTKKAVASIQAQDIDEGVDLLVMDNGSTDGTVEWLNTQRECLISHGTRDRSVAASWNQGLDFWFRGMNAGFALVVNNDISLRPDTYRRLVSDGGGFVTAVGSDDPEKIKVTHEPDPAKKRPHPDFSCYLIRREVYEKVGPFDENFKGAFGEDWDYHCRLHAAGITAMSLDLPFLHWGSMTIKNAELADQKRIGMQADRNREYFKQKWNMAGGSPEYYTYFSSSSPAPSSS